MMQQQQQQQQQLMRQMNGVNTFQQPKNPFLSPGASLLNGQNPIASSNLPLQMQQLNNGSIIGY
jgi:hypothetical protein